MKLLKFVGKSLFAATFLGMALTFVPTEGWAKAATMQQKDGTVKGTVVDEFGEPMFGAVAFVVGTTNSSPIDFDGNFELRNVEKGATIRVTLMGYKCDDQVWKGSALKFVMKEESTALDEVVVTAMGIMRKEKSLTYATQLIKADELLKAPDANIANSLEGKISGITITPSAGGAGGASKITLRGNKSIMGENAPLIVVDGVPMTNSIRGQASDPTSFTSGSVAEGSDYMSMINPDDIESMNVLKGANAAALYGSRAANGVIMITTKKGKEGKMEVTFTSSTTFDTPLMTPRLQNAYGAYNAANVAAGDNSLAYNSWGDRLNGNSTHQINIAGDKKYFYDNETGNLTFTNNIHLRNYAKDDIAEFYNTGVMTTNSVGVSGGTEKIQTYASYSNTYSQGIIAANKYSRNTFAFRQSYKLWDRLTLAASINYVQTNTRNRVGGGKVGNPIYHLYTTPRDTDMDYYKANYESANGQWYSSGNENGVGTQTYYQNNNGTFVKKTDGHALLTGPMQSYSYMSPGRNNPYWLINKNYGESIEDRFSASFSGTLKIIEGLNLQARVSLDHSKYNDEGGTYATTWFDVEMYRYGRYWLNNSRTNEIYTDYMLSYNKEISKDWSISATAGYVGHTIKGYSSGTYVGDATIDMTKAGIVTEISSVVNRFDPSSGSSGITSKGKSSNWDQAAVATAQVGWKDVVFVDASYRHDWYRPFRQFAHLGTKESYGYFGVGANAILSDMIKLPSWWNYAKYRLSYSEVGNSIPNTIYSAVSVNERDEAVGVTSRNNFTPEPEKTKSFETGLEMQFLDDCLNADITYYNSAMHNSYLEVAATNGKMQPVNSGIIRNQGIELTVGYDWEICNNLRWKTSANFSYNHNRIEATAKDEYGYDKDLSTSFANGRVELRYSVGGSYGDIYVTDFTRYAENVYQAADGSYNITGDGTLVHKKGDIYLNKHTYPNTQNVKVKHGGYASVDPKRGIIRTYKTSEKFQKYAGNLNSPYQLSWSNTFTYKDFTLYFLINGRIGGKVISLTEAELDYLGASERSGEARLYAEENNIRTKDGRLGMYLNDGGEQNLIAIQDYYEYVGSSDATSYIYDATNFRLRELSLGYTFRNLFGNYKNLNISLVCRNLFFLYKKSPVDPDVSLSTANGLGGIDMFNYPSARSFGLNIKLNL